jgi:Phage integrase family
MARARQEDRPIASDDVMALGMAIVTKSAGLAHVRFHDGRHTALTRLAEKGQPDWVIQAQMGHVSPAMMRTYSHIRRKALVDAAAALEPSFKLKFPRHPSQPRGLKPALYVDEAKKPTSHDRCDRVMSQFTSQWDDLKKEIRKSSKGFGSSGWTRTSNPPVNSRARLSCGSVVLRHLTQ